MGGAEGVAPSCISSEGLVSEGLPVEGLSGKGLLGVGLSGVGVPDEGWRHLAEGLAVVCVPREVTLAGHRLATAGTLQEGHPLALPEGVPGLGMAAAEGLPDEGLPGEGVV